MSAGLSSQEAHARLVRHGPNALPQSRPRGWPARVAAQFRDPLVLLLLAALALELGAWAFGGHGAFPLEAASIAAILLVNAGLGAAQEHRSERALAALRELAAPRVWVMRDDALVHVSADTLVPGDRVRLEAGERVPADARLADGRGLRLDESLVTGESEPVMHAPGDPLLAGTLVVHGHGFADVERTGGASTLGRLAGLLERIAAGETPLERRLRAFGRRVIVAVLVLAALLVSAGLAVEGPGRLVPLLLFAAALAVAAVPEGLPAVVTFALALGVERMARRNAVVRRLSSVESLGSVTVIATDKTGTLTENRMTVREVDAPDPERAARAMVFANDAEPDAAAGDPVDLALQAYAREHGADPVSLRREHERISERPFDSGTRSMRVTVRGPDGARSWLKGAPEALLPRCALASAAREDWQEKAAAYAQEGGRVLALATAEGEREEGLELLGLVSLWDPPRPEVPEAIRRTRDAGIRVLVVTGDHPATAVAVGEAVGLAPRGVVLGHELASLDDAALLARLPQLDVCARFSPEDKLRLVEALQARGEIVAVTGDGVNDAPALKRADVGVAMGRRGSAVAREAADVVLLDDHFATIVAAVEEGRRLDHVLRTFVRYLFATNLSEVLIVLAGAALALAGDLRDAAGGLLLPLTAAQILWINLVTDGLPALALSLDPAAGVMRRPPHRPDRALLERHELIAVTLTGCCTAAIGLAVLELSRRTMGSAEAARGALFACLTTSQLLLAYVVRRAGSAPGANPWLAVAVLGGLAAMTVVFAWPPLGAALGVVRAPLASYVPAAAGVAATLLAAAAVQRLAPAWAART